MEKQVFYIWQNQRRTTQEYIKKHLRMAADELENEGIKTNIIYRPAQDEAGSPNINITIKEKISSSDVIVADVSLVFSNEEQGKASNPNVMYEIGLADAMIGDKRIILLCDEKSKPEDVAFDINHNRISRISTSDNEFYRSLKEWLKAGFIEADHQKYIRKYYVKKLMPNAVLLLNFFVRFVYMGRKLDLKNDVIAIPDNETIMEYLGQNFYPSFFAKANFEKLLFDVEDMIVTMDRSIDRNLYWCMIRFADSLKKYHEMGRTAKYKYWKEEGKDVTYAILDHNAFWMNNADATDNIEGCVYFNENIVAFLYNDIQYIVDKRMLPNDGIEGKNMNLPNGSKGTFIKCSNYSISEEWVGSISDQIHRVIQSLFDLMKVCGYQVINFNKIDKERIGMITVSED